MQIHAARSSPAAGRALEERAGAARLPTSVAAVSRGTYGGRRGRLGSHYLHCGSSPPRALVAARSKTAALLGDILLDACRRHTPVRHRSSLTRCVGKPRYCRYYCTSVPGRVAWCQLSDNNHYVVAKRRSCKRRSCTGGWGIPARSFGRKPPCEPWAVLVDTYQRLHRLVKAGATTVGTCVD